MAKVAYTKLGLKVNQEVKSFLYNENEVEVKQYLPMEEKVNFIEFVLNNAAVDMKFYNPARVEAYFAVGVVLFYTNVNCTDKQKENIAKLYDSFVSTGFYKEIITRIDEDELNSLLDMVEETIHSVYSYNNSVLGLLDTIASDYSNLNLDATEIQKKLADPQNMELLRAVLSKLG